MKSAKLKLTEAQRATLRFAARLHKDEWDGVHPRRGQYQMFERLRLSGLLADAGMGVDADDHMRDVQLYVITEAGREALRATSEVKP